MDPSADHEHRNSSWGSGLPLCPVRYPVCCLSRNTLRNAHGYSTTTGFRATKSLESTRTQVIRRPLDWTLAPERAALLVRDDAHPFALIGDWAGGGALIGSRADQGRGPRRGSVCADRRAAGDRSAQRAPRTPSRAGGSDTSATTSAGGSNRSPRAHRARRPRCGRSRSRSTTISCGSIPTVSGGSRRCGATTGRTRSRTALPRSTGRAASRTASTTRPFATEPWTSTPTPGGHERAVEACVRRIHAGDLFQANICLRLESRIHGDALDLFAAAAAKLKPARAAYLAGPWGAAASLSPELFLARHGRRVRSAPIKGTRPATQRRELESSVKDHAENVMIVDLVRNDLGRVCTPGSIAVDALAQARPHTGRPRQPRLRGQRHPRGRRPRRRALDPRRLSRRLRHRGAEGCRPERDLRAREHASRHLHGRDRVREPLPMGLELQRRDQDVRIPRPAGLARGRGRDRGRLRSTGGGGRGDDQGGAAARSDRVDAGHRSAPTPTAGADPGTTRAEAGSPARPRGGGIRDDPDRRRRARRARAPSRPARAQHPQALPPRAARDAGRGARARGAWDRACEAPRQRPARSGSGASHDRLRADAAEAAHDPRPPDSGHGPGRPRPAQVDRPSTARGPLRAQRADTSRCCATSTATCSRPPARASSRSTRTACSPPRRPTAAFSPASPASAYSSSPPRARSGRASGRCTSASSWRPRSCSSPDHWVGSSRRRSRTGPPPATGSRTV